MKLIKNVAICSFLVSANKIEKTKKKDGARSIYQNADPTKPCTFSGEHSITGEDGFGEIYGYNLDYQSDRMGLSGYVSVENYYDYMNCYVEVNANPGCDAVEVTLTSLAMESQAMRYTDYCGYDFAYLTDLDGNRSEQLCGCYGDGCDDMVWGRNVTDPFTGDIINNGYYYNDGYRWGPGDYNYTYMEQYWDFMDPIGSDPVADKWRLPGNGFRLNIQTDNGIAHGEIKLDWTCVEDSTATVTSTTATTTTEYYDRYTTYSTGTTTSTTSYADSTWNPFMSTEADTSCAMFHKGLDSFFSQIRDGINEAIDNELFDQFSSRKSQFKNWMTKIWTKFENQLNGEAVMFDNDAAHRNCVMESVTSSPGENLSTEVLGSDCRLDLEYQGIPHMCRSLTRFMNFAYSKCLTRGRGSIHWADSEKEGQQPYDSENSNDTQGIVDRLEFRCKRMMEIISKD